MPRTLRSPLKSPGLTVVAALTLASAAQPARVDASLATLLNFEREQKGGVPAGWRGGPSDTLGTDDTTVHGGKWSARILRSATSSGGFSSLTTSIPVDFDGNEVELRGFLRTQDISGFAGLWLRQDGTEGMLAIDNMQQRQLKGTTDWNEYSIKMPLKSAARNLVFGVLVSGQGVAWADDLQLLIDGRPAWDAPKITRTESAVERDQEFDGGSKIALTELTPAQIENLALLGEVWGFLKHHHPAVTTGKFHWDYELFRVIPAILAAENRASAERELVHWIDRLGELKPVDHARPTPAETQLHADSTWFEGEARLGRDLATRLRAVHAARPDEPSQFYVSFARGVGNPEFLHEAGYQKLEFPDSGYQLLALFRFWNIIRYWFPYRDVIGENWEDVLREFIPRLALARDRAAVELELIALIARVHDTHANLWSSLRARPPSGDGQVPVVIRFIEGRPTVTEVLPANAETAGALQRGDVLLAIDGRPLDELLAAWSPYYAASNEPTRRRDLARSMTYGALGPVKLRVLRDAETIEVEATRVPASSLTRQIRFAHDLPGPAFRRLSPDVAYLKLSAVKTDEIVSYLEKAAGTKGWILDLRNYPSAFVVFALGSHLVEQATDFVRFTGGSAADPGAFAYGKILALQPEAPRYTGKLVILVDEVSQSSAEYHAMAFRVVPGAKVIGSTTAGADGNVSAIPLPGSMRSMISGIGVFYPDNRPTQRLGILPDIEVTPTLAGIKAGRDEVLEAALRQILGPQTSVEELRKLSSGSNENAN